jgi:hypothetical protein
MSIQRNQAATDATGLAYGKRVETNPADHALVQ